INFSGVWKTLVQSCIASLVAGYVAYVSLNYFVTLFVVDTLGTVFLQGFLACFLGLAGYAFVQYLFKSIELREICSALHRRFTRNDVVVAQEEDVLSV
ncbi:MAG: hypothetical protein NUW00_04020, partial [Candidatus Kaiserbacteria bacterium]|nr:hypothetical protein [Candidatus Kaiserbacteria bacterium]